MENNKDWEELEKWNSQNEAKNQFYQSSELKAIKDKKAKNFSKMVNVFSFTIITPIIIAICILAIAIFIFLVVFFHHLKVDTETDILKQLKNQYSQNFVILDEKSIDENEKEYKIYPKDNKNLVFKAVQNGFNQYNDYYEYLKKQILQEYINTYAETNIKYIDDTNISNNYEFYKLRYGIEINNYSEISQAVKDIFECNDYIYKEMCKITNKKNIYFEGYLKLNDWTVLIENNFYNKSLEYFIYNVKYSYIDYLKNNNIKDSSITNEEINNIWKPKELKVYLNNKLIENETATYNLELKEYEINFNTMIKKVNEIEKKYDKYGNLDGFIYNEKEYGLHYNNNELEKNNVPYQCRISILEKITDCKISYDYNNKIIYIIINK